MTPAFVLLAVTVSAAPSSMEGATVQRAPVLFAAEGLDPAPRLEREHGGERLAQLAAGARRDRRGGPDEWVRWPVSAECQELLNMSAMAQHFGDDVLLPIGDFERLLCRSNLPVPRTWPNGKMARVGANTWYWPNGKLAQSGANTWYWPNGKLARNGEHTWYWPNGKLAKNGRQVRYWPNGKLAQNGSSTWYWPNGKLARSGSAYYSTDGQFLADYASFIYLACTRDERACWSGREVNDGRRGDRRRQLSTVELLAAAWDG